MPRRDLVVVGASAGGVEALRHLVHDLPADLPACVLVVLHMPVSGVSVLPAILDRAGALPVQAAQDGDLLTPGRILVAVPDHHLVVRENRVALAFGPKENGHRPSVDALFRSAARWGGSRAVGVVLSGTLDDGAAGLLTIVEQGGAAVVTDPDLSAYAGMPRAALNAVHEALCVSPEELAGIVTRLCSEELPPSTGAPVGRVLALETDIARLDEEAMAAEDRPGVPAAMSCPDCDGTMFEIDDGSVVRYRCRVGHAWSPESLLAQQVEASEAALWAAIRVLEEKGALHRTLADRAERRGNALGTQAHLERSDDTHASAAVLRDMLRRPLPATHHDARDTAGRAG